MDFCMATGYRVKGRRLSKSWLWEYVNFETKVKVIDEFICYKLKMLWRLNTVQWFIVMGQYTKWASCDTVKDEVIASESDCWVEMLRT